VKDAISGKELFRAKFSYSASCNTCAGTRHNYTLDVFVTPLDGGGGGAAIGSARRPTSGIKKIPGMFISTSSSPNSPVATGGHGVMDLRNMETIGRVIPGPTGAVTIKDGSQIIAFRVGIPVSAGYGNSTSEMLIEDSATTALVGRIVKTWGKSDSNWSKLCCCGGGSSGQYGNFMLDMSAVSNVKKRALLITAGILADGVAFSFNAAPPIIVAKSTHTIESGSDDEDKKPLVSN